MARPPQTLSAPTLVVKHRALLTIALMLSTIMQALDTTIANVALPQMQAALGAAQNQITWVLTSYIVAAAIATPLTGWLSDRVGQKRLFMIGVIGFTGASMLCGLATSLEQIVVFRIIQGIFGAVLAPLAQTLLLDINPRERYGQATALYGAAIMVAPIVGPTLGGYLTEVLDWRWVFFVNLPVGVATVIMLQSFMPKIPLRSRRFDFFGFGMLALAVGSIQLLLERGTEVSWFSSMEIWIYLGVAIGGAWAFLVHCATADNPFVDLSMFRDRNFAMGTLFIFVVGVTVFAALALLPPLLQQLMGYSVLDSGILIAPRGIATMVSMIAAGFLMRWIDGRVLVFVGLAISAYSLYMMWDFDLLMDSTPIIVTGLVGGVGLGLVFVPISTLTFTTLSARFRTDATSLFALSRNFGQSVGIALVSGVLANMVQVNQTQLGAHLTATSPEVAKQLPIILTGNKEWLALAQQLVQQQAAMIAYLDDFVLMTWITLAAIPIVFLLRGAKAAPSSTTDRAHVE